MTRDHFNSLADRLEVAWRDRPEGLSRRLAGWVMLGFAALAAPVVAGVMLLGAGVLLAVHHQGPAATLLAGAISLAGLGLVFFVLSCVWVRFEPPSGRILAEVDHPELFRLLHELGDHAGGVRFDQVMLDPEMNASVVQHPRLGIFGGCRTLVVVGLPLMEALSAEEFKAVLAHEIGHLTHADGMTGAWLQRTRATWERVVERLSKVGYCPLLGRFFLWYWPRFNSRACLLSRFSELAADRFAARVVSPEVLAAGLRRLAVVGRRVEVEFWESLDCQVEGTGELPADVMERLVAIIQKPALPEMEEAWMAEVLEVPAAATDSHPGLAVRLAALGWSGETAEHPVPPPLRSAAEALLPVATRESASRQFSREWLVEARASRSRRFSKQSIGQGAGHRRAWERIAALVRLDGLEKVQPEVVALLERHPGHSGALYLRGSHLAQQGDPQACDFLERATDDPTLAGQAFEALAKAHALQGRSDEAGRAAARGQQHEVELRAALVERSRVGPSDRFFPQDLGEGDQEALRDLFQNEPAVRRAWIAAKEVRHFPRWPNVVIVLEFRHPMTASARRTLDNRLMQLWCGEAFVTVLASDEATKPVLRAIRRGIPDAEVYRRK